METELHTDERFYGIQTIAEQWEYTPNLGGSVFKRKSVVHDDTYSSIISLDNLFTAWTEFRKGKRNKPDVQLYERYLEDNLFRLHYSLKQGIYPETIYKQFRINDPKPRLISKASVECRLLHHAIYRVLYPAFDPTFIFDSYSCRNSKGTHKAFQRLITITRKVSQSYVQPCWALKFDVKRFFDSIDHAILFNLLAERINDRELLHLLDVIIGSFHTSPGKGMPLGNLTSQLFANVYMDPLDKFVRNKLQASHYLRYADDMILIGSDPSKLLGYFVEINAFVKQVLKLEIHPQKISLRKLSWGIDFVGYVALPHYTQPRRKTVKRIFKRLSKVTLASDSIEASKASYLGYLNHAHTYQLQKKVEELVYYKKRKKTHKIQTSTLGG